MQKSDRKLFLLHTFQSTWWMTCSVLSSAIWNHRIMSITISQKHIFILIFHYSIGRLVSSKFSLELSAANDDTLSKFKSHYSSMLFLFPSVLFLFVFLYWKKPYIKLYCKKNYQKCSAISMVSGTSGLKQKYMPSTKSLLSQQKAKWLLAILTVFVLPRHVTVTIGEFVKQHGMLL